MLPALESIDTQQADPTEKTMKKVKKSTLRCNQSGRNHYIPRFWYGARRLKWCLLPLRNKTKEQSRWKIFMPDDSSILSNNGAVITTPQIIKAVMSSATKSNLGALFINFLEAIAARQ